jgi:hypothetical protein
MQFPSESQARQGRRSGPVSGIPGLPRTQHRAAMQPGTATELVHQDAQAPARWLRASLRWNRSTRPPESTSFCLPV